MGGGGPSNVTTSSHAEIPGQLSGKAFGYANDLNNLATSSPYGYQYYNPAMNPAASPFTPLQQSGMAHIVGAEPAYNAYAGSGLNALQGLAQNGGGMNPFLPSYMDASVDSLVKNYRQAVAPSEMTQMMKAGAFGGSADAEARALNQYNLGENLSHTLTNIAMPAFNQQLGTQLQAAQALPALAPSVFTPGQEELQLGTQQQGQGQNFLNAITQGTKQAYAYPYQIMQQLGGGLTSLLGPFSGTSQISPNMAAMGSKL